MAAQPLGRFRRGGREYFCISNVFTHWFDAEAASPEFRIYRTIHYDFLFCSWAQRLVAQPLGHFRLLAIIVTTNLKPHFGVRSKSLGQVACSHVLGMKFPEMHFQISIDLESGN
jgi:hypothetical protein